MEMPEVGATVEYPEQEARTRVVTGYSPAGVVGTVKALEGDRKVRVISSTPFNPLYLVDLADWLGIFRPVDTHGWDFISGGQVVSINYSESQIELGRVLDGVKPGDVVCMVRPHYDGPFWRKPRGAEDD